MSRSVIDFNGRSRRDLAILKALHAFYRTLNALGCRKSTKGVDVSEELKDAVLKFSCDEKVLQVYNYQLSNGKVVTVTIANVRGEGPLLAPDKLHV